MTKEARVADSSIVSSRSTIFKHRHRMTGQKWNRKNSLEMMKVVLVEIKNRLKVFRDSAIQA